KSRKKFSAYDKPMTNETPVFLEYPRDRPTGHPESSTRGAREHARGAQQPRMANLPAPHSVSKLKRQPRAHRSRGGWQSDAANGGSVSGRGSIQVPARGDLRFEFADRRRDGSDGPIQRILAAGKIS